MVFAKALGFVGAAVVSAAMLSGVANAQFDIPGLGGLGGGSVGTKFVCCQPESVSCLGGGGGTVWHTTLRDRAFTQADARLRCGFHRMFWATHSCPADSGCNDGGGSQGGGVSIGNATLFDYGQGYFRREGSSWKERSGSRLVASFQEIRRDANFIYLSDRSRNMVVALGMSEAYWGYSGQGFNLMYRGRLR